MSKIHPNTPKISVKTPFWPRMSRVKNNTNWLTKITALCFSGHLFGLHFSNSSEIEHKERFGLKRSYSIVFCE